MLAIADLKRLMTPILRTAVSDAEVTIEVNPGDVTYEYLHALRKIGFNRLSMGVQSFNDTLLQRIGRRHTATQAHEAVQIAQEAGFRNISIDLMYGLPEQTLAMVHWDVMTALSLGVQHISTYCLSYEDGTPMTLMRDKGEIQETDEETLNRMFDNYDTVLSANGWEHYEVSNFALPGYRSRHNSSYWTDIPYIGLGAGAHSYDGQKRWSNKPDLEAYISGAEQHIFPREEEVLTDEQQREERIMLGLRTKEGIAPIWLQGKEQAAERWIEKGLLYRTATGNIAATLQGWHILNTIIVDLI